MSEEVAVLALDIHRKFSQAGWFDWEGKLQGEERVGHGDKEELRAFFRRFAPGTEMVLEAGAGWAWIVDLAEEEGLRPHLADQKRLREMAKGLAKSDRKDERFVGKVWLAGEIFPEVYLAPGWVREKRGLFRARTFLLRLRTAIKNNIHGQMIRLGLIFTEEVDDLFSQKGRRILAELELAEKERYLLEEKLKVFDEVSSGLAELSGRIREELGDDPRAEILLSIPGVGELTAYALLAELGEIERFANGRALAAYAGLLPLANQSGEKEKQQRTNCFCNKYLRWAALEAVTGAVRCSPRMNSLYQRVRSRNPRMGGKARVAVAREILELASLLLRRGELYQEQPPPRPGSERKQAAAPKATVSAFDPNRTSQIVLSARPSKG